MGESALLVLAAILTGLGGAWALTRYVRRPLGSMPAFTEKVLPDPELRDIYAYLKSIPAAKPAKDIPLLNQIETTPSR